jgi:hypothetical protein
MKIKVVIFVSLGLLSLGVLLLNPRSLAVAVLGQVPRGVAIKLVQGLATVHGMNPVEIDHRHGRYGSAAEHLRLDVQTDSVADRSAVALSSIGTRVLGDNATGSYGTLLGYSVSMGGDVDGRPGDEVVAGGYEYSDHYEERGIVLLWGSGQAPLKILGPRQHRAWFGHSVANNGDFDGDGLADVLVGARFANNRAGAAYLVPSATLSHSADSLEVDTAAGVIEFVVDRAEAELGFEVYFGDDWDGDDRAELVLRAHVDGVQSGGVFVVYSSQVQGNRVELGRGAASIQIGIGEDYADFGRTISTIGDIDGDGADELLLGAQAASRFFAAGHYVPSRFYVVMSRDLARRKAIGRGQILQVAEAEEGEHMGSCVGRLGDMDGDGVADFSIGARYGRERRGVLHIVSGARLLDRAVPGEEVPVADMILITLLGERVDDVLGWSCAEDSADLDGDGIGEVVVGARGADGLAPGAGAVYIVKGRKIRQAINEGRQELQMSGETVLKIGGDRHGARLGSKRRFAAAGDFDGDGVPDLAVGTPGWHEGGYTRGRFG